MKEFLQILLIFFGFLLVFYGILHWAQKRAEKIKRKTAEGILAKAKILQIDDASTGHTPTGYTIVKLTLEIQPASGENYQTSTRWSVKLVAIPEVQKGKSIEVKIDAENKEIIYPNAPWAEYWENL